VSTKQPLVLKDEAAVARVNLRVAPSLKRLLQRGAAVKNQSLTDFIVAASRDAAETVLAEQTQFVLSPERWAAFAAALDAPARDLSALRQLLAETSVFESR
jgi:uncharacterized protein (DUF1778 family)